MAWYPLNLRHHSGLGQELVPVDVVHRVLEGDLLHAVGLLKQATYNNNSSSFCCPPMKNILASNFKVVLILSRIAIVSSERELNPAAANNSLSGAEHWTLDQVQVGVLQEYNFVHF